MTMKRSKKSLPELIPPRFCINVRRTFVWFRPKTSKMQIWKHTSIRAENTIDTVAGSLDYFSENHKNMKLDRNLMCRWGRWGRNEKSAKRAQRSFRHAGFVVPVRDGQEANERAQRSFCHAGVVVPVRDGQEANERAQRSFCHAGVDVPVRDGQEEKDAVLSSMHSSMHQ